MASTIQVANETVSSSVRTTKDGRTIRYSLQVIQQPERARACGSGAKSSADRRPVDPPPIVELKVFEGEQDITFGYNANFFLFATLENARTIAPGRAPASTQSFPVLTGTPVAGMAYLDRPSPAGYFIFPDLSVRHEGKYRLSFALYEELKDQKDMDPEDRSVNAHTQGGLDAHVSHRLEVKSAPFVVFSAKKFPGLSESTALSRMVAEQGCRVRIRRDVRMRRRENKSNKDWDEYEDDGGYDGARRASATPDSYPQQPGMPTPNQALDENNRPRSVSNASNNSFAPPRRQSMEEMQQQPTYQSNSSYQQMPPPQSASYSQVPQYSAPPSAYQTQYAPPQPPAPLMQPPQTPYSQQSHQPAHSYQSQPNMHMGQSYGYMNNQGYQQQSHYEQPAPVRQEPAVDYGPPAADYRRSSIAQSPQQYPGPSQLMPSYGSASSSMDYGRPQQMVQPLHSPNHIAPVSTPTPSHLSNGHALAPLRTVLADVTSQNKLEPVSPSYQSPPNNLSAPMSATSEIAPHHAYLDSHAKYNTQPLPSQACAASIGQKRSYSSTFDTRHLDDRLQQGARPNPSAPPYRYDGVMEGGSPDMEEPMDRASMSYRRADGSHRSRRVPELGV